MITYGKLGLLILACTTCLIDGHFPHCEPCPGGTATLKTGFDITGNSSSYKGFVWVRPGDGQWVITCNPNCSSVAGYSATRNSTHSTLTIASVQPRDVGVWLLKDANDESGTGLSVCHLSAREVTTSTNNISSTIATTTKAPPIPACLILNLVFVWLVIPIIIIGICTVEVYRIGTTRQRLYELDNTSRANQTSS